MEKYCNLMDEILDIIDQNTNVVFVGGWGDVEKCYFNLIEQLNKKYSNLYIFPYDYHQKLFELKNFAPIESLSERFFDYLNENQLLTSTKPLYLIGYSQGGMIILYAMGKFPPIRDSIRKFISIATPHGGAFFEEVRDTFFDLWDSAKNKLDSSNSFFGSLFSQGMKFLEQVSNIRTLTNYDDSQFIKSKYPNACNRVFETIEKEKLIEIYSVSDWVSPTSSTKRFEEYMTLIPVDYKDHRKIANQQEVIDIVIDLINFE